MSKNYSPMWIFWSLLVLGFIVMAMDSDSADTNYPNYNIRCNGIQNSISECEIFDKDGKVVMTLSKEEALAEGLLEHPKQIENFLQTIKK